MSEELKTIERLFTHVDKQPNGCWVYLGYKNEWGYGRLRCNGKKVLAHRLVYKHYFGEIPKGKLVCHKCDNPVCLNPYHLYLGTNKDNLMDMANKNRQWLQRAKEQGLKFDVRNGVMPDGYQTIK